MFVACRNQKRWDQFKLCSKPIARLRLFSSEYTCAYMCMCAVYVHIYTNIGFLLYFGKVKSVTLRLVGKCMGLEIVPQYCGTPAQATVMAFPLMMATVPKSSISHRTEQFPRFQLQQWLIWYVIIPWRAEAPHQIMAQSNQSPVPLKFIAIELS